MVLANDLKTYLYTCPMIPGVLAAGRAQCVVRGPGLHRAHTDITGAVGRPMEGQAITGRHGLSRPVVDAIGTVSRHKR